MGARLGVAGLMVVAALGVARGPARAAAVDDAAAKARDDLVDDLWHVVVWARGKKITGFRHRLCGRILRIDPDHRRARGILGYHQESKDGPWSRDPDYEEPPDFDVGRIPEAKEREAKALAAYRDRVLAALDEAPDLDDGDRQRVLEGLIDFLPDDATLRRPLGHVEFEGHWVLPETVSGIERRKELDALARNALASVRDDIRPYPPGRTVGWKTAFQTDDRVVIGNVDAPVGLKALLLAEAGDRLCRRLFGSRDYREDVAGAARMILLQSRDTAKELARNLGVDAAFLRDMDAVSATSLPDGRYLAYWRDPMLTETGGLRRVISTYVGVIARPKERGWMTEGIGQRITWYVSGRHGAPYVSLAGTGRLRAEEDDAVSLPRRPADWPQAAARVLTTEGPRALSIVLTKSLNGMERRDVLVAYGLATYLLEARPKRLVPFVRISARSHDAEEVCRKGLGADVASTAWRVRRWLLEIPR